MVNNSRNINRDIQYLAFCLSKSYSLPVRRLYIFSIIRFFYDPLFHCRPNLFVLAFLIWIILISIHKGNYQRDPCVCYIIALFQVRFSCFNRWRYGLDPGLTSIHSYPVSPIFDFRLPGVYHCACDSLRACHNN